MSDKKEHTTQGGVDWELRTAEDAMVDAPGGSKALAQAMRRHADGVRNMMVSELVPSFENAIDNLMAKHVKVLSEQIGGLGRGQSDLQSEFRTGLSAVATTVSALVETIDGIQTALDDIEAWRTGVDQGFVDAAVRMSKIEQQDRDDIRTAIASTNLEIAGMKEVLKRYDSELRELVDRLAARGGGEDAEQASDALPAE